MIRILEEKDYLLYKSIRLELLEASPTNFGSSKNDEEQFDDSVWKTRLSKDTVFTLGYFDQDEIIGLCIMVCSPREKMKHVASIHSVYVKPLYRGKKVAEQLLVECERIATKKHIRRLHLSVVSNNVKAISLYQKLGYEFTGKELEMIHYNNQYYDLDLYTKKI